MARVKLNSVYSGISGKIGNVVFYNYSGSQFIRRYVVPHNPRTQRQQNRRALFAEAVAAWQTLPSYKKEQWQQKASLRHLHGYNYFISMYMRSNGASASDIPNNGAQDFDSAAHSVYHHCIVKAPSLLSQSRSVQDTVMRNPCVLIWQISLNSASAVSAGCSDPFFTCSPIQCAQALR